MPDYDIPISTQRTLLEKGDKLAIEICKILGIDFAQVPELNLNIKAGEAALVTVKRFINKEETTGILKLLQGFKIDKYTI